MSGQEAGSPWRLRQWGRDQVEANEFYSVVTWVCRKLPLVSQSHWIA